MVRLEKAIDEYLRYRGEVAIRNSIAPGTEVPESSGSGKSSTSAEMEISP